METNELSSSNIADNDIFSNIPDHIIHRILGFLPIKEVIRTSCISKSWHQAWLTFPIPKFNMRSRDGKEEQLQFLRFVYNTLNRFGWQNGMKNFNFNKIHSTRWLGMALAFQVEHLALCISNDSALPSCLIPDRILSAYWLKSLKLVGSTIGIQSLSESSHVDLPSLKSLCIKKSHNIKDQQLEKLLSGCPALEEIALLECELLSKVDIFNHPNLETLEFTVSDNSEVDHVAIRVRAPKLKYLSYASGDTDWDEPGVIVNIHNSPELKSLSIISENKNDEWFHKFIAQFPVLENLSINNCLSLSKIRITNPLLEKINIRHCDYLVDMLISSKKLTSLSLFTQYSSIPYPSIRMEMDNPPNDYIANFSNPGIVWCSELMHANWYCKLKEFLTRPFTFKSLKIHMIAISADDGDMNGKDVQKKLPHEALNIEKLTLCISAPSACHPHILNGLLSTCHPATIELDVTSNNSFGKLVCEELGKGENNSKCLCKDDFKCWKHQLKEVKIEKIKGINLADDLDWETLFNLLPTLKEGTIIYFKLKW